MAMSERNGGERRHRVELSKRAESALRALPRDEQRLVARGIDRLASDGVPADAPEAAGDLRIVDAGNHWLMCLERDGGVVIAAIEAVEESAAVTVKRAAKAPLLSATGSRVGCALSELWTDVRLALRAFRQQPTFVAVAVLTLAIGIGGNTAVFGVFSNIFLGQLPLRDADRMLRLRNYSIAPNGEMRTYGMTSRDFLTIRERSQVLEDVVAINATSFTITGADQPERVQGVYAAEHLTQVYGVEPVVGTTFTPEQEAAGTDSGVVLIGNGLWQRRFGADPGAVGSTILVDGQPKVIVGVMPPGFRFPYGSELWTPGRFDPSDGRNHELNVMAHMKPGVTIEQARQEMDAISASLAEEFPDTNRDIGIQLMFARDNAIDGDDDMVQALLVAVAFLLLIACVNVTNVLVSRFLARQREVGIRAALGAGRFRQLRQFLTETVLIFVAGGAAGLLFALWLRGYLVVLVPESMRTEFAFGEVRMSTGLVAFTFVLSISAALLCGGVAALKGKTADLQQALKEGGRSSGSRSRRFMQRGLVVAEVSLALVLLVGAGLMIAHFRDLQGEEFGFEPENLLTMRIDLDGTAYETTEQRSTLLRGIEESLAAVPGVVSVGMTTTNPLCCGDWAAVMEIEGREPSSDGSRILVTHRYVTPGLFEAMEIDLTRGRLFGATDDERAEPVVVVDQRLAEHFWPCEDAVGKRVRLGNRDESPWRTVIGVVERIKDVSDYDDAWYLPFYQDAAARGTDGMHFMLRLAGDAEQIVPVAHRAVWDVAPDLAIYETRMMAEVGDDLVADDRLGAVVAAIFALLGTALAGFGIYGLMAFFVGQQRLEIGTRLALGARPVDVLGMVLRQSLLLTGIGLAVGLAAVVMLSRVMAHFISGLDVVAAPMVAAVALLLGAATLAATWIPARRAARVDPMVALRGGS